MVFEPIVLCWPSGLGVPEEILEKFGGKCIVEYNMMGNGCKRIRAATKSCCIRCIREHFRSIPRCHLIRAQANHAKEAIFEAECVAVDLKTGDMRPFQELMHRPRKYGVEAANRAVPYFAVCF